MFGSFKGLVRFKNYLDALDDYLDAPDDYLANSNTWRKLDVRVQSERALQTITTRRTLVNWSCTAHKDTDHARRAQFRQRLRETVANGTRRACGTLTGAVP